MPIHNSQIAEIFNQVADILEIEGANEFRIRAYRNAGRVIRNHPRAMAEIIDRGEDLRELPGIGNDLAGKVIEIIRTGKLETLDELKRQFPAHLADLMRVTGLGPKRIRILERFGIDSLSKLRLATTNGRLRKIPGFGVRTEENIRGAIAHLSLADRRVKLMAAEEIARPLVAWLEKSRGVGRVIVAGSYRRRQETVGDLDILVTCDIESDVMDRLVTYEEVQTIVARGETRSSVILRSGLQIDLRLVPEKSFGAALLYFTGSKAHTIELRKIAQKNGLKINEYGLFEGPNQIAGETEAGIYQRVGLRYIEPELRENRGEIEAARRGKLPKLITLSEIRGDLHCHTKDSDGQHSLEEMAEAARACGYEYLAITDHSKHLGITHGLDAKSLMNQIRRIEQLNARLVGLTLLKGIEVDILGNGRLDLEDDILKELDFTVCSIHSEFNLAQGLQTERILRAMDNPYFNIFAHPTGRLINSREPYKFNMEKVMQGACDRGCALEVNAQPDRLDLMDVHCQLAKDFGVKLAISTDAHSTSGLEMMRFGIDQARRGWIEPKDVINTLSLEGLRTILARRRK